MADVPHEERRCRGPAAERLRELEAEFQAIIDSDSGNAARRCASLCLEREEVAAQEERHRQLLSVVEAEADRTRRQRLQPALPSRQQPPQQLQPPPPLPPPQSPGSRAHERPWTHGFYEEQTRAIRNADCAAAPSQEAACPKPEDGYSSDEDYARILQSAFSLKDKLHALLQEEGERRAKAARDKKKPAKIVGCDLRKTLGLMRAVKAQSSVGAEAPSRGSQRRPSRRQTPVRAAGELAGGGAEGVPAEQPPAEQVPLALPFAAGDGGVGEPGRPCVRFQFILRGVDYGWLCESPSLVGALEAGLKDAIAEEAGEPVRPSHVTPLLSSGPADAVAVQITVEPPEDVDAESVRAALSDASSLASSVLSKAAPTHGLSAVSTGHIVVCEVCAPHVQERSPSSAAPPTPPLWTTALTASAPPGIPRMSLVDRKAANEELGRELADIAAELRRSHIIGDMDGLID